MFTEDSVDGFIHCAFLRGRGLSAEEVRQRPVIGICSSWSELNPCNAGLDTVAAAVTRGVTEAGGLPVVFPMISISEPFTRPSSLLLRNLMAMDVEQMIVSSPIDAVVLLGGCDKTVPAQLVGAISADKPAVVVTAGPRPVGNWDGEPLTVDDLWPFADRRRQGRVSEQGVAAPGGAPLSRRRYVQRHGHRCHHGCRGRTARIRLARGRPSWSTRAPSRMRFVSSAR